MKHLESSRICLFYAGNLVFVSTSRDLQPPGKRELFHFYFQNRDAEWNSHSFHDGWDVLPPLTVSLL